MARFNLYTKNGKLLQLSDENEIHRGGEGRIMLLPENNKKVAKIYHQGINVISQKRFDQLQKLDKELFVKPIDLLFDNNKIVGFTMEYAGKDFFPLSAMFNKAFCQRNRVNEKLKKNIANKLIDAVKIAHFNGFVIGDLNQFNVLVNINGQIKLIDVDSYETPGYKHSGCLLDDIRDYYYNGQVSMNSDYFALSVLLFYLFTYTHPFKGVHNKYKNLAERMIHKIPVFAKDPMLTVPKCYHAITDTIIHNRFEKIYLEGERFLMSIDGMSVIRVQRPVLVAKHDEKELKVRAIFNGNILNAYFNKYQGYIQSLEKCMVYSCTNNKSIIKKYEFHSDKASVLFIGNQNILLKNNENLMLVSDAGTITKIQNFSFEKNSFFKQYENILVVISPGKTYKLFLDEVLNSSIRMKRTEVFSEAFHLYGELVQNTGGVQRIYYNTAKDIASLKIKTRVKHIVQNSNIGMIQYVENDTLKSKYFKIEGLKTDVFDIDNEFVGGYTYMKENNKDGFVFEPADDKILIRRTIDFKIISELACSKVSRHSSLYFTKAGIVVWEDDEVNLLNRVD